MAEPKRRKTWFLFFPVAHNVSDIYNKHTKLWRKMHVDLSSKQHIFDYNFKDDFQILPVRRIQINCNIMDKALQGIGGMAKRTGFCSSEKSC